MKDPIAALRALRADFGPGAPARRAALLARCAAVPLRDPRALREHHDLLLFLAAHPDGPQTAPLVEAELARAAEAAAALAARPGAARALVNTGIAGTTVEASLTLDLTAWLAERFPRDVEVAWEDGSAGDALDELLWALAAPVECDGLLGDDLSTLRWLRLARGGRGPSDLSWLMGALRALECPPVLLDRVFEGLDLQVRWVLRDPRASTTFGRFPPRPLHSFRGTLQKGVALRRLLGRALPAPQRLSAAARRDLVATVRAALAVRQRETDPVTYANPAEVTLFRLERGVDVAILGMAPERRLPIESFFGYVVARNRVPVGYGGGWVFFDRAEIGVNVFDPFRGGESAYLFGQVLRVYRGHYGVRRFLVDPFQIGRDNPEGIRSGAFWFYYRLGFRPLEAGARSLAASEWERIGADRSYRTPFATLRRLARARLALDCPGEPLRENVPELRDVGLAVTSAIGRRFGGDRVAARRWALRRLTRLLGVRGMRRWPAGERRAFAGLAPLAALIGDLPSWTARERRALVAIMRAKGGRRERDYALMLRGHGRLRESLWSLAQLGRRARRPEMHAGHGPASLAHATRAPRHRMRRHEARVVPRVPCPRDRG